MINRCRICKREKELGIDHGNMVLEMDLCNECKDKIISGEIKIGRLLTRRLRKRVLGIW